jgi:hypothetical protein
VQETIELIDSILESGALPSELHGSLQALRLTLTREDHTVLEVGAATGKLTEGLVTHLHTEFFGKPPGTFFNGIEAISQKPPTQEKYKSRSISKWFYSYLHTLRVLRNESAHSQTESIRFPLHLEHDDLSVLLSNLGRVLRLHISIIQ